MLIYIKWDKFMLKKNDHRRLVSIASKHADKSENVKNKK